MRTAITLASWVYILDTSSKISSFAPYEVVFLVLGSVATVVTAALQDGHYFKK